MKVHLAPDLYHEVLSKTFPDEGLIETVYGADLLELANDISNDSDACKLFANWSFSALRVAGKHEIYRHPVQYMLAKLRRYVARHGMAWRYVLTLEVV